MSTSAEPIDTQVSIDTSGEVVRELLIKYQRALGLIERLAIGLLDSVQPDAEPMTPEQARERRRTVAEAMTMVASETPHGEQLWKDLAIERRLAHPDAPRPAGVAKDRRARPANLKRRRPA